MDLLDVILVVVALGFAVTGYRQGLLVGVLSFAGFLGGGILGALFAPALHRQFDVGNPALFGLLVVFIAASIGQLLTTLVGVALRRRITWRGARAFDSAGGAVVSVVSVLLVAWIVGTAVVNSSYRALDRQIRHSAVLTRVDALMPDSARTWFSSFRRLLDQNGFPQVFGALGPEHIVHVPPPDPKVAHSAAVRLARSSIVKVTGDAPSCQRRLEGSGFVFAADHVMTNAHVVAGVHDPTVTTIDGATHAATVVLYDPHRDVAVLAVPGLSATPLSFAGTAGQGTPAVAAGYPENGPFRPVAARIREVENAQGPDIYQSSQVTRQIYSIYADIRPGNSGGPLLAASLSNGRPSVLGVVFAAAVDDPNTGYALTAGEVSGDARQGATATTAVSTRGCD